MTEGYESIDAEKIKQLIKEIVAIVEEVPEPYKQKCFEILFLTSLNRVVAPTLPEAKKVTEEQVAGATPEFVIPDAVKALLKQNNIPETSLQKLFRPKDGKISADYRIPTTNMARAQIQLALLIALENALNGGKFEFSEKVVRQKCIDYDRYNESNFATNFKAYAKLFKSRSDPDHVELNTDGKSDLAETILEITQ